jgi:acyl-CoA synthetase (AMP-forming)/AMP-acid ligase II
MNLASAFADSVQQHSEKSALFWGDRTYSYGELSSHAFFVAGILRHQFNVSPGDRVGLWLKNCPEFVPSLFGVLQAGAVAVPINNFLKPDEVSFILHDAGIDVIIADGDLSSHFQTLKARRPSRWHPFPFRRAESSSTPRSSRIRIAGSPTWRC